MTQEQSSLLLARRDPSQNMARFYRIEITPDLFGGVVLIRNWGRIGHHGQERRHWFADLPDAQREQQLWLRRKLRRGYGTQEADSGNA
jgi:predicted DNA-binding WGR domain protein